MLIHNVEKNKRKARGRAGLKVCSFEWSVFRKGLTKKISKDLRVEGANFVDVWVQAVQRPCGGCMPGLFKEQ